MATRPLLRVARTTQRVRLRYLSCHTAQIAIPHIRTQTFPKFYSTSTNNDDPSSKTRTIPPPPKRTPLRTALTITSVVVGIAAWIYVFTGDSSKPVERSTDNADTLSEAEKEKVLTQHERVVRISSGSDVQGTAKWKILASHFHVNAVASNDPIEDYHAESRHENGLILGIFDGHSGTECSALISQYLPHYIGASLSKLPKSLTDRTRQKAVASALKDAFLKLDADIINGGFDSSSPASSVDAQIASALRPAVAGSCAIVAYLEGSDLYVACTGDSRAVLGKRRGDGSFEAIPLSADHTIKNPVEHARMLEEHPGEAVFARGRVLGGLMPTRAFGDARYKWPAEIQNTLLSLLTRRSTPRNYQTPPYITAEPEVSHYTVNPSTDRFLILGSDGLYDELTSEECVDLLGKFMENQKLVPASSADWASSKGLEKWSYRDGNAATHLIRNALGKGDEGKIRKLLALKPPQSRKARDDMTVNVLFFGEER
ncbi:hypothetical protein HK097_010193, partial [Rhizophlyctis rosea]